MRAPGSQCPAYFFVSPRRIATRLAAIVAVALCAPSAAWAWGDEGHEIIGGIADHYLDPAVRAQVDAMLAGDATALTPGKDIASEATWADHWRDSDRPNGPRYKTTHNWHFVDIEIAHPDLDAACFAHPALPAGTPASQGPANDCVVDKIGQFSAELATPATPDDERRMALQFLLHFVGDLHQPLHASDNNDVGGNNKNVTATGIAAGTLHHYWDTEFVQRLGTDAATVAQQLVAGIDATQAAQWSAGTPADWANETFAVSRDHAYAALPAPGSNGKIALPASYVDDAAQVVRLQLQKAGVRLATVLNQALGSAAAACTAAQRAAALPNLAGRAGFTVTSTETTTGMRFSAVEVRFTSTLAFDAADPAGLTVALEAALRDAGWHVQASAIDAGGYSSRATVAAGACGTVAAQATLLPLNAASAFDVEFKVLQTTP